jgi:hypothetical protein
MGFALALLLSADPAGTYQSDNSTIVITAQENGYLVQWAFCCQHINYVGYLRKTNAGWEERWCRVDTTDTGTLVWRFTPMGATYTHFGMFKRK